MQSQMIGMQSSLDRILSAVQTQSNTVMNQQQPSMYPPNMGPGPSRDGMGYSQRNGYDNGSNERARHFPPLPGFAPPVSICGHSCNLLIHLQCCPPPQPHKYASYGIVPSTAPSSEDESEDTLPRATLNAPIEALQGLANAAAEAAAAPSASPPRYLVLPATSRANDSVAVFRVKKRKRAEPIPRNAFPHVVEKVRRSKLRMMYLLSCCAGASHRLGS